MIRKEEVFKIGRIGKTHGVRGEVMFQFDDDVFDRTDADYLILDLDGIFVPFFIEEYRFRSDSTAILKIDGINTQERARELTGTEVFFPLSLVPDDEEEITLSFLVGFDLIEAKTKQQIGRIASIDDQTANILFCLEDGTLIPANDDLITHIDKDSRQITIDLPEGLLDL